MSTSALRTAAAGWAKLPARTRSIAIDELDDMAKSERRFAKGYSAGAKLRRSCTKMARIYETIGELLRAAQAKPKRRRR